MSPELIGRKVRFKIKFHQWQDAQAWYFTPRHKNVSLTRGITRGCHIWYVSGELVLWLLIFHSPRPQWFLLQRQNIPLWCSEDLRLWIEIQEAGTIQPVNFLYSGFKTRWPKSVAEGKQWRERFNVISHGDKVAYAPKHTQYRVWV